ncbi:MAG: hypothetical protein AABW59_03740 [archaeon]
MPGIPKKPINPAGKTRPQMMGELRQRIAKIQEAYAKSERGTLSAKPGRPRLGTRGTNWAEAKMSSIKKIAEGSGANCEEAHKVLKIFFDAREWGIEMPAADHQVLTNIANNILIAEKARQEIRLNPNQKALLEKYYQLANKF